MKHVFFLLLFLAVTSCNGKKSSLKISEINSFPKEEHITVISLNLKNQLYDPSELIFFRDTLLLTDNTLDDGLIHVASIKDDSIIKKIIQKGRGSNELLSAWSITSEDNLKNFWIFDVVAANMLKINIDNALSSEPISTKRISFKDEISATSSIDLLNNSEFICSGGFNGFRVAKIDTSGNIKSKVGLSPEIAGEKEFDQHLNEAYQGTIKRKPDGTKFVIACKYADQIEIFDSKESKQELVIKGPIFTEPTFGVHKSEYGDYVGFDPDLCIQSYSDVTLTNDYIIGLFSGGKLGEEGSYNGNTIHVFDWNGKAVARLFLDRECMSIRVNPINNRVYLVSDNPTPEIYYFDLKI